MNLIELSNKCKERQKEWIDGPKPDLTFRTNELAGEAGEVCNVAKKLQRERYGWKGSRDTIEHLAEELADVIICATLIADDENIDLSQAVIDKFNATSDALGFKTRFEE